MFKSHEELFQATHDLISSLEKMGHSSASRELRDGMAAINGLTDGWAAFLESVQKVKKNDSSQLNGAQQSVLGAIHAATYEAVYRHTRNPWWKFW